MTLTSRITCDDIRNTLGGTVTGSTYYFWEQSVDSGSVQAHVTASTRYFYNILGRAGMEVVEEIAAGNVTQAQLDYGCFRLLVILSGGVIVDGFSWEAGVKVENPKMYETYMKLIAGFKDSAYTYLKNVQEIYVMDDGPEIDHGNTATSVM